MKQYAEVRKIIEGVFGWTTKHWGRITCSALLRYLLCNEDGSEHDHHALTNKEDSGDCTVLEGV